MHITIYKINDQDPLYNTRTLTPHSVITYMGKNSICINRSETSCARRKKKHPQDCNSFINSSSNDEIKTAKAKRNADSISLRAE